MGTDGYGWVRSKRLPAKFGIAANAGLPRRSLGEAGYADPVVTTHHIPTPRRLPRRKAPIKRPATVANDRVPHTKHPLAIGQYKKPRPFSRSGFAVRIVRYASFLNFSVESSIAKPQFL